MVKNGQSADRDVHLNSSIEEGNVGYVFPRVIWLEFHMGQCGDEDHQEDAPTLTYQLFSWNRKHNARHNNK